MAVRGLSLGSCAHIASSPTTHPCYTADLLPQTKQYELQCAAAGVDKSQSCADFLRQMGYREYARYLAFFFPFIHERSLLSHLRACPYRLDQDAFKVSRQLDAVSREASICKGVDVFNYFREIQL